MSSSELALRSSLDLRTIGYETPVTIPCGGSDITMTVKSVIDWICPGADAPAALKFLMTCRNLGLNPLAGDAHLVPMGGKYATVIGKGAYLKKAQEHPAYDGHDSGITIWFNNEFHDIDGLIRPPVPPDKLLVVGGWARVWRKGVQRPVFKRLSFEEYAKKTKTWDEIGLTMIAKAALVAALREAFGIEGYDESESPVDLPAEPVRVTYVEPSPPNRVSEPPSRAIEAEVVDVEPRGMPPVMNYKTNDPIDYVRPDLIAEINRLADQIEMTEDDFLAMLSRRGVQDVGRLTVAQAEEIIARFEDVKREAQASEVFGPSEAEAAPILLPEFTRSEAKSA